MPKHILITGPSGSGKTYISGKLHEKGINAIDADTIPGLADWYDEEDKKVGLPPDAGKEFLDNHRFLWDREFLEDFLQKQDEIYLFGMSGNVFDMLDLFDRAYFLKTDPQVLAERLRHEGRKNPMGKTEYQLQNALDYAKEVEETALKLCIEMIEADQTPEEIFSQISS